jgi:hypothetical protein
MPTAEEAIDSAIREVTDARAKVSRRRAPQVRAADELDYLKAVAYAWFKSHQTHVADLPGVDLVPVSQHYTTILTATGRHASRSTYVSALKGAKGALLSLRAQVVQLPPQATSSADLVPDFSALAADDVMKGILARRWTECLLCTRAGAHLAATVMMGALLEALFVARANKMSDKKSLFSANSTPKDSKTGKPIPLQEWTLAPYIDVSFDLGWITKSAKDVAAVLRDYRNYIHPEKERRHGVVLAEQDSRMFWEVTKVLATQLLNSVAAP